MDDQNISDQVNQAGQTSNSSQIVDSSSKELLDEMNQKQKKIRFWPGVGAAFVVGLIYGFSQN